MFFFAVLYQTLSKEKSLKPLKFQGFFEISALRELGSAAGGFQAVLLTLLHTRIAGEEAGGLEGGAELGVDLQQSAGHAVADGAGLAGHAAAGDGGDDVHLAQLLGGDQGLADQHRQNYADLLGYLK